LEILRPHASVLAVKCEPDSLDLMCGRVVREVS